MTDGTVPLEAAFRGRRLLGRRLNLPDGYKGLILEKMEKGRTEAAAAGVVEPPSKRQATDVARTRQETERTSSEERGQGVGESEADGRAEAEEEGTEVIAGFPHAAQWRTVGRFSSFAYWNHDRVPKAGDGPARACDWLRIAKELHAPISLEDLERQLSK
ncbi:unnamed protein product [Closterium sp. NIES-65]|nr:unnamed protein product [Closterium sp. NIES-65]